MTIVNKITLLIIFLLSVLSANTFISLRQMNIIRLESEALVRDDLDLMEAITAIHQLQLQKGIVLQQLISISEEMAFGQTAFARIEYLRDQLKNIRVQLQEYAQAGAQEMLRARRSAVSLFETIHDDQRRTLRDLLEGLNQLERARLSYNLAIDRMLDSVESGSFQLSLEDLENIQTRENELSRNAQSLLKRVQNFFKASLDRTAQWEDQAQDVLVALLCMTVFIACLLAWWIVRSVVRPLSVLSKAAGQIGSGDFNLHLNTSSRDEFAHLARAFNTMSLQLNDFKQKLEQQNLNLKETNADIDRFIHVMGHDIVGPLTVMIGYCSYLEQHDGQRMDPKSLEALQGIRKSSTRMHQMVKELLEFTKSKRLVP